MKKLAEKAKISLKLLCLKKKKKNFTYYRSENSVLCSVFKKKKMTEGGVEEAYMISVPEKSAIKILDNKK